MESEEDSDSPQPSMIFKGGEWVYPTGTPSETEGSTQGFTTR